MIRRPPLRAGPPESGETLIELLVSLVILGICGAAIIGSLLIAVDVSQLHEKQVQQQQYLRSWAESVSNTNDATYPGCSDACYIGMTPAPVSGLSPSVGPIECWSGTAFSTSACATRDAVKRVTLTVSASGALLPSASRSLKVVVRRACLEASSC